MHERIPAWAVFAASHSLHTLVRTYVDNRVVDQTPFTSVERRCCVCVLHPIFLPVDTQHTHSSRRCRADSSIVERWVRTWYVQALWSQKYDAGMPRPLCCGKQSSRCNAMPSSLSVGPCTYIVPRNVTTYGLLVGWGVDGCYHRRSRKLYSILILAV